MERSDETDPEKPSGSDDGGATPAEPAVSGGGDGDDGDDGSSPKYFHVAFFGSQPIEDVQNPSKYSQVLNEIKNCGSCQNLLLNVTRDSLRGLQTETKDIVFEHNLQNISRFAQTAQDHCYFTYTVKEIQLENTVYLCLLFKAADETAVLELFTTIRESTKEIQHIHPTGIFARRDTNASLTNPLILNITSYHYFEVLYVGKIKVSHCKAPPTFIDEALEKFRQHELEKIRIRAAQNRRRYGSGSSFSISSPSDKMERSLSVRENELRRQMDILLSGNSKNSTENLIGSVDNLPNNSGSVGGLSSHLLGSGEELAFTTRVRANTGDAVRFQSMSGSSSDLPKRLRSDSFLSCSSDQNRTMLLQIGLSELSLISLDKKLIILNKPFKDISHCSQGIKHNEHFGFICRDQNSDVYVGYVFKCQSQSVSDEIMGSLKQAFTTAAQQRGNNMENSSESSKGQFCDTCPIYAFCKLNSEIEGCASNKVPSLIQKFLDTLPEEEQIELKAKFEGAEINDVDTQNEVQVMLIRALCETKQMQHKHTGDLIHKADLSLLDRKHISVIDDLKKKAKRSFTNSFENLFKVNRKSRDDARDMFRERSLTIDLEPRLSKSQNSSTELSPRLPRPRKDSMYDVDSSADLRPCLRPRSSTIGATGDIKREKILRQQHSLHSTPKPTPKMNIFLKVGNQSKPSAQEEDKKIPVKKSSWRQAIFQRVVANNKINTGIPQDAVKSVEGFANGPTTVEHEHRSPAVLRSLWKKAIMEQILLIRMEKENRKLKARQDAALSKRIKLDYEEITPCLKEVTKVWETMLNSADRLNTLVDHQEIVDAVKAGVPKQKRGEIWQFLAEQYDMKSKQETTSSDVDLSAVYEDLLRQLTSHQHAILIDLGRTFPHHPYFSVALGQGQLSLFNLLKAYSLLDKEVGYCQGLSFIAGVLLLHMDEDSSFELLKHLLFRREIRKQYKPDMVALQIQMYQLSRLVHDTYPDLYEHFERQEIAPTLYAAPWFLTLFASQFPLGFVARVFDLLFVDGMEIIFKVALVLLGNHKELIMQCTNFESVMEFLKTTLPSLGIIQMERVINQVFTLDISRQLQSYEVEYHVLQEEMFGGSGRADVETVQRLETTNRSLKRQNSELHDQLQSARATIHGLENMMTTYYTNITHLETRIRELELDRLNLKRTVEALRRKLPELTEPEPAELRPLPPTFSSYSMSTAPPYLMQKSSSHHSLSSGFGGSKENLEAIDEVVVGSPSESNGMVATTSSINSRLPRTRHTSDESGKRVRNPGPLLE